MDMNDVIRLPIAELTTENAQLLADCTSIDNDLAFCMRCCERLSQFVQSGHQDMVLQRSLWTSALVAYARCFASGVRYGLTPEIFSKHEGKLLVEAHKYFIEVRNKHVAHSVNPFEQIKVGVALSPTSSDKRQIEGIQTLVGIQLHGGLEEIEQLRMLTRIALEWTTAAGKVLHAQVLEEAQSIPIDELYKRANPRIVVPPSSSVTGRR
jgi:hypothetical protein